MENISDIQNSNFHLHSFMVYYLDISGTIKLWALVWLTVPF